MYIMEKNEKTPILGSIIILYKNNALWGLIDIEKKSSLLRLKEVNFQKKVVTVRIRTPDLQTTARSTYPLDYGVHIHNYHTK